MTTTPATQEIKTVLCPIWADAKTCKKLFGLCHPKLKSLADTGEIRRKKMGDSIQSAALYNIADVNEYMERDA